MKKCVKRGVGYEWPRTGRGWEGVPLWLALAPDSWFCFVVGKNTWRNMDWDSLIIHRISVDFPVGKFLPFLCCRLFYGGIEKGKTKYGREACRVALSPAAHITRAAACVSSLSAFKLYNSSVLKGPASS